MITEGYLARHSMGKSGMRGPALLDVAQDYALRYLYDQGFFDLGAVLKGGTSLRKFRAGNQGRFSTDLDFAVPNGDTGDLMLDTLHGASFEGVTFSISERTKLRGRLEIDTTLGPPDIPARVEITARPLWLPVEFMEPIALPVHKGYEFDVPRLAAPALEEALAEKLAAWRRRRKMRDLYDLFWFGHGPLDEPLVRRLLVLKVWHDVVDDGLGSAPFDPGDICANFDIRQLPHEDIGLLTQRVAPGEWLSFVRQRYAFVTDLDGPEREVVRCSPADRWRVQQLTNDLRAGQPQGG